MPLYCRTTTGYWVPNLLIDEQQRAAELRLLGLGGGGWSAWV